jgi:hypothetical protein
MLSAARAHKNGQLLPPRRQERQVRKFNFFAAFAPLREILNRMVFHLKGPTQKRR